MQKTSALLRSSTVDCVCQVDQDNHSAPRPNVETKPNVAPLLRQYSDECEGKGGQDSDSEVENFSEDDDRDAQDSVSAAATFMPAANITSNESSSEMSTDVDKICVPTPPTTVSSSSMDALADVWPPNMGTLVDIGAELLLGLEQGPLTMANLEEHQKGLEWLQENGFGGRQAWLQAQLMSGLPDEWKSFRHLSQKDLDRLFDLSAEQDEGWLLNVAMVPEDSDKRSLAEETETVTATTEMDLASDG